jgi:hypothetical protein
MSRPGNVIDGQSRWLALIDAGEMQGGYVDAHHDDMFGESIVERIAPLLNNALQRVWRDEQAPF